MKDSSSTDSEIKTTYIWANCVSGTRNTVGTFFYTAIALILKKSQAVYVGDPQNTISVTEIK